MKIAIETSPKSEQNGIHANFQLQAVHDSQAAGGQLDTRDISTHVLFNTLSTSLIKWLQSPVDEGMKPQRILMKPGPVVMIFDRDSKKKY